MFSCAGLYRVGLAIWMLIYLKLVITLTPVAPDSCNTELDGAASVQPPFRFGRIPLQAIK